MYLLVQGVPGLIRSGSLQEQLALWNTRKQTYIILQVILKADMQLVQ